MGEYVLKTNNGEVIKRVNVSSLDDAIDYFAKMKKLEKQQLISIFKVELLN